MNTLLWVVLPYVCLAVMLLGFFWRYRYDKFGWTSRSSQLYENRLLRLGSPLFHFGILLVLAGHVVGLLVPARATAAVGLSEHAYHLMSVGAGTLAGVMTVVGLAILVYRRRTVVPVFQVTTRMDKAMYLVLGLTILLGAYNTIGVNLLDLPGRYPDGFDYRETVSVWFRDIFLLRPNADLMARAPLTFRLHALLALALFALWPFTRLVHVLSAPLGYLTRPYLIYRTRDPRARGSRPPQRGWEPAGGRR